MVVDDGSSDGSAERAREAGAEVLRHGRNRGKGAALRTGLAHLLGRGFTHAFTLDADGQHLPDEMPALLAELERHPRRDPRRSRAGARPSRRSPGGTASATPSRTGGSRSPPGASCPTPSPAFASIRSPRCSTSARRRDRYAFESEVLILASLRGIEIVSREVAVYYPPPAERVSHYEPWVDTVRIIFTVVPFLVGLRR